MTPAKVLEADITACHRDACAALAEARARATELLDEAEKNARLLAYGQTMRAIEHLQEEVDALRNMGADAVKRAVELAGESGNALQ
ncbi:MAG: hypothetical protein HY898_22790 [Deltaproteobacteria bacterium]|nr:hypothetical protein [Deltaproteobacteria bacterium]